MPSKILDILPPGEKKKEEAAKKEVLKKEKPEFKFKITFPKFTLKKGLVFLPLFVLLFFFTLSFRLSKVEIKIWPEVETPNFRAKITVDKEIENPDFNAKVIPGKIFEVEKNVSGEFSSSGKVLKKAEGIIRLYNNFTTQDENWLSGTRFVSSDGKLFKSKDKISVPGAQIKNGKMIPSYVDVSVIAAEGGADYNISPSKFSIIAFRGTPRYTKYYGESFEAMLGGGEVPQVKKEDLENAQNFLIEKAKTESKAALKEMIPSEFLFSEDALETKILEKFSLTKERTEVEKFNFQVKAKSTTLAFKRADLNNFAKDLILSQISEGKKLFEESLRIEYSPETTNYETGKISLSLNFSAKIYSEIDVNVFKKGLIGKSLTETRTFLENQPDIIRSEVRFFPFWIKNIPGDIEKIKIQYPLINSLPEIEQD
jgi:hypothetical protein